MTLTYRSLGILTQTARLHPACFLGAHHPSLACPLPLGFTLLLSLWVSLWMPSTSESQCAPLTPYLSPPHHPPSPRPMAQRLWPSALSSRLIWKSQKVTARTVSSAAFKVGLCPFHPAPKLTRSRDSSRIPGGRAACESCRFHL